MVHGSRPLLSIEAGVEQVATGDRARHYHREGYANLVLSGRFVEAAFAGRSRVGPGDVLIHGAFDAHADMSGGPRGPTVLRLPWRAVATEGRFKVADPDQIARLAERSVAAAVEALAEMLEEPAAGETHWTARLAAELAHGSEVPLHQWAEENGLSPPTVSRGFAKAFGASPKCFRLEARARNAWRRVVEERGSLTAIAHEAGFADLAHMSRSIAALTGRPPSYWRQAQAFAAG
jgi:AraC-like DNA-binding protein